MPAGMEPLAHSLGAIVGNKPKQSLTSETAERRQREIAQRAGKQIFSCYPDYGKAPPEYLATIVEVLENYPPEILAALANPMTGVPAKHPEFLPTAGAIAKLADEFIRQQQAIDRAKESAKHRRDYRVEPMHSTEKPRPFPRLWDAFANDAEIRGKLNAGIAFETLSNASRYLATSGIDAARKALLRDADSERPPVTGLDIGLLFRSHDEAVAK